MKEIEELLAKLDDGDNQDVHEAILKAFADEKQKLVGLLTGLEVQNIHDFISKAQADNYMMLGSLITAKGEKHAR